MKNLIYYFSATGNTERAVGIIAEALRAAGQEVVLEPIRHAAQRKARAPAGEKPEISPQGFDRIIVAFPTLALIPPVLVQRFIKRLPSARRTEAAPSLAVAFTTDGGGCGPAPLIAARLLRRRGYAVALSGRASYAENWTQVAAAPKTDEEAARKTETGDRMARVFADKLIAGAREAFQPSAATWIIGSFFALVFPIFGRRFLGKTYFADPSCDACGLCKRTCPAQTIVMAKGKRARPFWKTNCEACNRCINICPRKAINFSVPRSALLIGLIIAAFPLGLAAFHGVAWPGLAPLLPEWSRGLVNSIAELAILVLAHFIVVGPVDALLLRFLQRIPPVARFFSLSFTKEVRRYRAPGFKPRSEA